MMKSLIILKIYKIFLGLFCLNFFIYFNLNSFCCFSEKIIYKYRFDLEFIPKDNHQVYLSFDFDKKEFVEKNVSIEHSKIRIYYDNKEYSIETEEGYTYIITFADPYININFIKYDIANGKWRIFLDELQQDKIRWVCPDGYQFVLPVNNNQETSIFCYKKYK